MDKILNKYLILMIYLILAAVWDLIYRTIPRWLTAFAFLGWLIFAGGNRPESFIVAFTLAAAVYLTGKIVSEKKGMLALGMGDIHIIFIMGLYFEPASYLMAVFLSLIFTLIMVIPCLLFTDTEEFPLAPAFLFGAAAALW